MSDLPRDAAPSLFILIIEMLDPISSSEFIMLKTIHRQVVIIILMYPPFSWCRCEAVVGEFLVSIKKAPDKVKFAEMINILITHAQSNDQVVQVSLLVIYVS